MIVIANGHGGARPGAGRKKKPLADKIMEDMPGKRVPKVLGFAEGLPADTTPPDFLDNFSAFRHVEPSVEDIYSDTVVWLQRTGCLHLINPQFISDYALLKFRWYECEALVQAQLLTLIECGRWPQNPAADMSMKYLKQADVAWNKIWSVVAQNCEYNFGGENPNEDIMEKLLRMNLED